MLTTEFREISNLNFIKGTREYSLANDTILTIGSKNGKPDGYGTLQRKNGDLFEISYENGELKT